MRSLVVVIGLGIRWTFFEMLLISLIFERLTIYNGYQFTWSNDRSDAANLQEQLDKCFLILKALSYFLL